MSWSRAEDVDWCICEVLVKKRPRLEVVNHNSENIQVIPNDKLMKSDEDLNLENKISQLFVDLKTYGVSRDIVDSAKGFRTLNLTTFVHVLLGPLIQSGEKKSCELAERILEKEFLEANGERIVDSLLQQNSTDGNGIFSTDHSLLLWQRCFVHLPLPDNLIEKLIFGLVTSPKESSRLPAVIFALVKVHGRKLHPYIVELNTMLEASKGVMIGPCRKALDQLLKEV